MAIANHPVLIRESCLHLSGPVAHSGDLTLTHDTLVFTLSRRIERLLGGHEHTIRVADITSVEFGGVNRALIIGVGEQLFNYIGAGAYEIYKRLQVLFDHQKKRENNQFQYSERVLVTGTIYRFTYGSIGARGALTLTDYRLRFEPGFGLETRMWPDLGLDMALSDIQAAKIVGVRRRLLLTMEDREIELGGAIVPLVYSVLVTQGIGDLEDTASEDVIGTWPVHLVNGLLMSPGELVFSNRRLHFEPRNRLDAALGIRGSHVFFSDVTWLRVVGWGTHRLVVNTIESRISTVVNDTTTRFLDFLPLLLRAMGDGRPRCDSEGQVLESDALELFQSWQQTLQLDESDSVILVTPAVQWVKPWWVRSGWLMLTKTLLIFVPKRRQGSSAPASIYPLSDIVLRDSVDTGMPRLTFSCTGRFRAFTPLCGQRFLDRLYAQMGPSSSKHSPMSTIYGPAPFVEVRHEERLITTLRPGRIVPHGDGLGVLFTEEPSIQICAGAQLTLHVGHEDGVYVIRGSVIRIQQILSKTGSAQLLHVVIIAPTPDIQLINRRGNYRVSVDMAIPIQLMAYHPQQGWIATNKTVRCTLNDLSVGGGALTTAVMLSPRSHVMLRLPPRSQPIRVEAEVLDCLPHPNLEGHWVARVQFLDVNAGLRTQLNEQIVAFQRQVMEPPSKD